MQTIQLDLAQSGEIQTIYAKQGEVGRKFRIELFENGKPYVIPKTATLSIWYSGASGEGNYSSIDRQSAFFMHNSAVEVEIISQMLNVPGTGVMCLIMMNQYTQIATWNIAYAVESIPGLDSPKADDWFGAMGDILPQIQDAAKRAEDAANRAESPEKKEYLHRNFANVIRETMTGAEISTDLVSPIEHEVECKVGRVNLCSPVGEIRESKTIKFTPPLASGSYYLSAEEITASAPSPSGYLAYFRCSDGSRPQVLIQSGHSGGRVVEIPSLCPDVVFYPAEGYHSGRSGAWNNVQLTKGTEQKDYVPYISDFSTVTVTQNPGALTFKPNADGIITGMKSIFPSMSILTDNSGLNLEITYNADTKKFVEANSRAYDSAGYHNSVYRGKNLGTSVTEDQYACIKNGTFKDLYIGDYWIIGDVNWRIASFDYFLNSGDSGKKLKMHHAVIVPDSSLGKSVFYSESPVDGYYGSSIRSQGLNTSKEKINSCFPDHVLTHRDYLINSFSDGTSAGGLWTDSTVDLMNEFMVYGNPFYAPMCTGRIEQRNIILETSQLPLFFFSHSSILSEELYWLRDQVSEQNFSCVRNENVANMGNFSLNLGVRPYFLIG